MLYMFFTDDCYWLWFVSLRKLVQILVPVLERYFNFWGLIIQVLNYLIFLVTLYLLHSLQCYQIVCFIMRLQYIKRILKNRHSLAPTTLQLLNYTDFRIVYVFKTSSEKSKIFWNRYQINWSYQNRDTFEGQIKI